LNSSLGNSVSHSQRGGFFTPNERVMVMFLSPGHETLWDEIQLFSDHVFHSPLYPEDQYRQSGCGLARFAFDSLHSEENGTFTFRSSDSSSISLYASNVVLDTTPPPWSSLSISSMESRLTSSSGIFLSAVVCRIHCLHFVLYPTDQERPYCTLECYPTFQVVVSAATFLHCIHTLVFTVCLSRQ